MSMEECVVIIIIYHNRLFLQSQFRLKMLNHLDSWHQIKAEYNRMSPNIPDSIEISWVKLNTCMLGKLSSPTHWYMMNRMNLQTSEILVG